MEESSSSNSAAQTWYREYLRSLARAWLDPSQSPTVDPSNVVETLNKPGHNAEELHTGPQPELANWLRSILESALTNSLGHQGRQTAESAFVPSKPSESSPVGPSQLAPDASKFAEEIASRNEQMLRLARALARLPDDQRTVLEMKHLVGFSLAEICDQTGWSKTSVVGLLFRAVKGLRVLLREPDQDPGRRSENRQ